MKMKIVSSNTTLINAADKSSVYNVDEVKELCLRISEQGSQQGGRRQITNQTAFTCARCSLPMHILD
jgi:hypothetical protein